MALCISAKSRGNDIFLRKAKTFLLMFVQMCTLMSSFGIGSNAKLNYALYMKEIVSKANMQACREEKWLQYSGFLYDVRAAELCIQINWKLRTEKWLLTQFAYGIRPPTELCLRDAHLLTWSWKRELVTYKNILVLLECADRKFQFWVEWYVSDYMMKYCGHLFPLVTIITSSFKGYFILLLHIGVGYVAFPIVQGYAETKSLHLTHCQEVRCLIIREDLDNTSGLIEVWHSLNAMTGFTVKKPEVGPHTFCTGRYNLLSRIGLRTSRRAMFYSR